MSVENTLSYESSWLSMADMRMTMHMDEIVVP